MTSLTIYYLDSLCSWHWYEKKTSLFLGYRNICNIDVFSRKQDKDLQ